VVETLVVQFEQRYENHRWLMMISAQSGDTFGVEIHREYLDRLRRAMSYLVSRQCR
jgi:hypothetical protein